MKEFEHFLKKGSVNPQQPDANLSSASYTQAQERLVFAKRLSISEAAKFVLENAYESMREAADALLYKEGFKSYSHEASIVYLQKHQFSQVDLERFDYFRTKRNNIKYYGADCDAQDAKDSLVLAEKIIKQIGEIIK